MLKVYNNYGDVYITDKAIVDEEYKLFAEAETVDEAIDTAKECLTHNGEVYIWLDDTVVPADSELRSEYGFFVLQGDGEVVELTDGRMHEC